MTKGASGEKYLSHLGEVYGTLGYLRLFGWLIFYGSWVYWWFIPVALIKCATVRNFYPIRTKFGNIMYFVIVSIILL